MHRVHHLLFFFCLLSTISYAQGDFRRGYIITVSGDSLSGYTEYQTATQSSHACFFRSSKKSKKIRYLPTQLKAFGFFGDKRFEAQEITYNKKKIQVFLEVLVKGELSLYRYRKTFHIGRDSLMELIPPKKRLVETNHGRYSQTIKPFVGLLNSLLADCSLTANQTRYNEKDLTNILQNFNRCKGAAGTLFKEEKKSLEVHLNVMGGLDRSSLQLLGFPKNTFTPSTSASVGLGADLSSAKIYDELSFSVECWYIKKMYQGYVEETSPSNSNVIYRDDYFIDVSFIKIPIGFRYNFLQEAATPYVRLGFATYLPKKASISILHEREEYNTVSTTFTESKLEAKTQSGFWLGVGYQRIVYNRIKAFAEVRYERTNGFTGSIISSTSKTSNVAITVGIRF